MFRVCGTAFNREGDLVPRARERQAAPTADGGLLDARESGDAPENLAHEGSALRDGQIAILTWIIRNRQPDPRGDYIVGVEAGTDLEDLPEAVEEEAGPDQKDQGKGYLRRDQRARDAHLALARARAAAAFSEACDLIGAGALQGWRQTENNSGQNRNQEREEEDACADRHFIQPRKIGGSEFQQSAFQPHDGKQGNAAGNESEEDAFREQLGEQANAPSTESHADRNFALATRAAG